MGRRRKRGRDLDGVLILDKSAGMSSNQALQQAKRLFFAAKAGHTGALDPLATGVLPVCFGEATKFSQFLLDADKSYRVRARFGVSTDTQDSEGEVLADKPAGHIGVDDLVAELDGLRGSIKQLPPMYSAIKRDGQPLYKLARQGIEVDREERQVEVYSFELTEFSAGERPEAVFEIDCSKGTYVRTLIADLGDRLDVGACVTALRRTQAGPFSENQAVTLEALEDERAGDQAEVLDHRLLPTDSPVAMLEAVELEQRSAEFFIQGQAVMVPEVYRFGGEGDIVRIFAEAGDFLGLAEVSDDARVLPRRLVARH